MVKIKVSEEEKRQLRERPLKKTLPEIEKLDIWRRRSMDAGIGI